MTMTRFCRSMFGLAAAALLVMTTVAAQGQSAAKPTTKALATIQGSGHESGAGTKLGLIDVRSSDLLQKTIKNNWVSYNGDYTGRRFSSLDPGYAGERQPPGSEVGFPHAECRACWR